jgi:hypothetical protein
MLSSHPPPPPVDYIPPSGPPRNDPWRPWWLRLLLLLRVRGAAGFDAARRERYEEEMRDLIDE